MGIKATIIFSPTNKRRIILLAVSVGSDKQTPEAFDAIVDELQRHINQTKLIKKDDIVVVVRGCLLQGYSLKFKFKLNTMKEGHSLAIYKGEMWEKDCAESLRRLGKLFTTQYEMIRWVGNPPTAAEKEFHKMENIYAINKNFIVTTSGEKFRFQDKDIPLYDINKTENFSRQLNQFEQACKENENLKSRFEFAVAKYWTDFTQGRLHEEVEAKSNKEKPDAERITYQDTLTRLPEIKGNSTYYVEDDVTGLADIIRELIKKYPNAHIDFIYPFPKGNARESATMEVLTHELVLTKEQQEHLNFPTLTLAPVFTREEQKRIAHERAERAKKETEGVSSASRTSSAPAILTSSSSSAGPSSNLASVLQGPPHDPMQPVDNNKRRSVGSPDVSPDTSANSTPSGTPLSTSPPSDSPIKSGPVQVPGSDGQKPTPVANSTGSNNSGRKGSKLRRQTSAGRVGKDEKGEHKVDDDPSDTQQQRRLSLNQYAAAALPSLSASMQHTFFAPNAIDPEEIKQQLLLGKMLYHQVENVLPALVSFFPDIDRRSLPVVALGFMASLNEQARSGNIPQTSSATPQPHRPPSPGSTGK